MCFLGKCVCSDAKKMLNLSPVFTLGQGSGILPQSCLGFRLTQGKTLAFLFGSKGVHFVSHG